ncbi:MAG TPA: universal stress protein [Polyangia bacterium]|nr:universal stress protein [Polyangia bacterium]HWE27553.1 universal stress protein [Polyangia bacterium]
MRFARILVPTDFSGSSRRAAAIAAELAGAFRGSLTLVHVYSPDAFVLPNGTVFTPSPGETQAARDRADAALSAAKQALARCGAAVEVAAIEGDVADELLERANSGDYDLVVMGTHGRSGFQRVLIGSVAEHLMRHANVPVLTVREQPAARAATLQAGGVR